MPRRTSAAITNSASAGGPDMGGRSSVARRKTASVLLRKQEPRAQPQALAPWLLPAQEHKLCLSGTEGALK